MFRFLIFLRGSQPHCLGRSLDMFFGWKLCGTAPHLHQQLRRRAHFLEVGVRVWPHPVLLISSTRVNINQSSENELGALRRPHFRATLAGSFDDNHQSTVDTRLQAQKKYAGRGENIFPGNATFVQQSAYDKQENLCFVI
jgi:hypothetical protein